MSEPAGGRPAAAAHPAGTSPGRPAAGAGPVSFRPVLAEHELKEGQVRRVEVEGRVVALWRAAGGVYATDDTCTHEKASLSEGEFDPQAGQVACPRHGARFDVRTGRALTLPAYRPLRTYPVRVEDGQILVGLPAPGAGA